MSELDRDKIPATIAEAITTIMGKVDYVQKKGVNEFHKYNFAAVGDVLTKLQPAMSETGLVIVQNQIGCTFISDNSVMLVEYEFILSHKSGETWGFRPRHSGMAACKNSKGGFDDKAANKCQTAARKYFLLALFHIPTGDHVDPDKDGDIRVDKGDSDKSNTPPPAPKATPKQDRVQADTKTGVDAWIDRANQEIDALPTAEAWMAWQKKNQKALEKLSGEYPDKHQDLMSKLDEAFVKLDKQRGKAA